MLNIAKYRPIAFIAILNGLKDMVLGFGFFAGVEHVQNTQLFQHYDVLWPGVAGPVFGIFFFIIGLMVVVFALLDKRELANRSLWAQCLLWIFSTLSYLLYGQFIFAVILGLFFAVLSGYLSYIEDD